ncbi:MAG: hypothetical protein WBC40_07135 [Halobacteriota archaeon]
MEKEDIKEERHSFFPAKKLDMLIALHKKPRTVIQLILEEEVFKNHRAEAVVSLIYRLKRQRLVKPNRDGVWIITKEGENRMKYLWNRLQDEFCGV